MAVIRRTVRAKPTRGLGPLPTHRGARAMYEYFMNSDVIQGAMRASSSALMRELRRVDKQKFRMTGCPLGDFDAFMETANSLPLVIRGEVGIFTRAGVWVRDPFLSERKE